MATTPSPHNLATLRRRGYGACLVLASAALLAQPAIAKNGSCLFQTVGILSLSFGALDPSLGSTVVASMTVGSTNADQVGDCRTGTMTVTAGNGSNFLGGSRRLASGADFIPYSLSSPPTAPWTGATGGPWSSARPGNATFVPLPVITGTILGTDYQNATAGAYSDTVVLTVTP